MKPALRIKNILAPRLVETHGHLMSAPTNGLLTIDSEAPGTKETRSARRGQTMILESGWKRCCFPGAGIEVYLVPLGDQQGARGKDCKE